MLSDLLTIWMNQWLRLFHDGGTSVLSISYKLSIDRYLLISYKARYLHKNTTRKRRRCKLMCKRDNYTYDCTPQRIGDFFNSDYNMNNMQCNCNLIFKAKGLYLNYSTITYLWNDSKLEEVRYTLRAQSRIRRKIERIYSPCL